MKQLLVALVIQTQAGGWLLHGEPSEVVEIGSEESGRWAATDFGLLALRLRLNPLPAGSFVSKVRVIVKDGEKVVAGDVGLPVLLENDPFTIFMAILKKIDLQPEEAVAA